MKRIGKFKNYFLSLFIPLVLLLIIFYFKGTLGNIDNIYVSDLRLQHMVFLNYFRNIMLGKASLFYSFYAGMGSPMLATVIFYAISPVNFIMLFIKDIQWAILFVYIIKICLAGLSMFILLKYKSSKNNFMTVVFSTCYALGAFSVCYFFCVFWFDVLYLAPLVVLGIEKLFDKEMVSLLYILCLALAIICNIQMGFGLCVFCVVYFIYSFNVRYSISHDFKKFKQIGILFVICSLCAGAISSGVLWGFISEYINISVARKIPVTTNSGTSHIWYVLKNMFTIGNLKTDYFNELEPFIYSGLIVSFYSILYFFNNNIDSKRRRHAFGVVVVFLISFCIRFINLFWHLSSPVMLNYRYSIYLALFLVMIGYECYCNKDKLVGKDIVIMSISLLVGLFMIVAFTGEVYVIYTFVFLLLIFFLIIFSKNKFRWLRIGLVLGVFVELVMNGYLSIYTSDELPFYKYSTYNNFKDVSNLNDFDDNYRVMYNYSYTENSNDTLLLNKNSSLRYFSSVINGELLNFFYRNSTSLGNNNYKISAFETPLMISLLGNKYFYLIDSEYNNSIYKKLDSYEITSYDYDKKKMNTRNVYLYENPYALSLGYVIDKDVKFDEDMDFIDYQNKIIKNFSGIDKDILIRLDNSYDESDSCRDNPSSYDCRTYHVTNNTDNKLVYVHGLFSTFYPGDEKQKFYLDNTKPFVVSTLDRNFDFSISYNGYMDYENYFVSTYDNNNLIEALNKLRENELEDISISNNVMKGHINSSHDGTLFLSIPYENKFKVYVDGRKVKYYSLLDKAFMGLDIKEGSHDIKLVYVDDSLVLYVFVSFISLVGSLLIWYFMNRSIKRKQLEEKRILELELEKRKNRALQKENKVSKGKNNKKKRK